MNALDLFIAAIVIAGAVHGFVTGAIKQVAGFASLLLSFVLGVLFMNSVGATVADVVGVTPALAPFAGFVVVFLTIQLIVVIVVKMVERIVGALKLTAMNRLLGSGIGVLKGALALSVALMAFGYIGIPAEQTKNQSFLYEPVSEVLPKVWTVIGGWSAVDDLKDVFRQHNQNSERTQVNEL